MTKPSWDADLEVPRMVSDLLPDEIPRRIVDTPDVFRPLRLKLAAATRKLAAEYEKAPECKRSKSVDAAVIGLITKMVCVDCTPQQRLVLVDILRYFYKDEQKKRGEG